MANQSGQSTYVVNVEASGAIAETTKLLNSIANLNRSLQEETKQSAQAAKATAALAREQRLAGQATKEFAGSVDASVSKFQRFAQLGAAASVQLGDFITQVQSGGNVWIAASQQLGQFGSLLTVIPGASQAVGIGLMAVAAALPIIGSALKSSGADAESFAESLDQISEAADRYVEATERLRVAQAAGDANAAALAALDQQIAKQQGLTAATSATAAAQATLNNLLGTNAVAYAAAVQGAQQAQEALNKLLTERAALQQQADHAGVLGSGRLREQIAALDSQIRKTQSDQASWNLIIAQSTKSLDAMGLNGTEAAQKIIALNTALAAEPNLEKRNALMAEFTRYVIAAVGGAENLTPELQAALAPMSALLDEADPLAKALKDGASSAGLLTESLQRARDAATGLAQRSADALEVIWRMNAASKQAGEGIQHTLDMADAIASGADEIDARLTADLNAIEDRRKAMEANVGLSDRLKEVYGRVFDQERADRIAIADADHKLADARERSTKAGQAEAQASRDAAKARRDSARAAEENQRALDSLLSGYATPMQELEQQARDLAEAVAAIGGEGKLNPEQLELYRQAQASLADQTKALNEELSATGQIFSDSLQGLFDDLIDGSKSASEAFGDFIDDLLAEMTRFLFSQQLQAFMSALASAGVFSAGTTTATAGVQSAPVAANLLTAPLRVAAPTVPSVASRGLGQSAYAIVSPGGVPSATAQSSSGLSVNIYNQNGSEVEAKESTDAQGHRQLDIVIRDKVRELVSTGALDREMQRSYGMRRKPG
ncbi:MAG TPA: hypothetical protein VNQ78_18740 [Paracoccus sp. (in: a-proteobacteria)]|uniref:hypothetical protein n=1 Tax=Paracoccus sp. TaxID=267 RepID=UPI002C148A2A|nr:hypothetical protein [Paracoccus sp. (in: a-proteobacteria)]HWL58695.1 hypothetical protein [Paracoccus sp. (in: a-proteobacteria)]